MINYMISIKRKVGVIRMENKPVTLQIEDAIGIITLNSPGTLNALDFELGNAFVDALEGCAGDEVRAVVLTGAGKAFSAGGNLKMIDEYAPGNPPVFFRDLSKILNRIITEMRRLPKPIIGAINGAAGGAGMSFALACDLRIMSEKAFLKQAYTGVGVVPDGGWTLTAPLILGFGRACEMAYLDHPIDAQECLRLGMAQKVVPPDKLYDAAMDWARQIASGPSKAFAEIKALLHASMQSQLEVQAELERRALVRVASTHDHREGLSAFLEKRTPKFTGK